MKKNIVISVIAVSILMSGCGSSNSADNSSTNNTNMNSNMDENTTERFTKMTIMGDIVEVDNETGLEWIGSAGDGACKPNAAATTQEADISTANAHCENLSFAGHDDWRAGTPEENANFIKDMKAAGKIPFYGNPGCPRLIGIDNNSAKAINTHNLSPVGKLTPWSDLITQDASNYGIKCVREK
jgi:hypothetical protein